MRSRNQETMQLILEFINDTYFTNGVVPTLQEIADFAKMSRSSASRYLGYLEEAGKLTSKGGWQGFKTREIEKLRGNLTQMPVVGDIACGIPIMAEENIEDYLCISASFLKKGNYFALRAKGDSMIEAGIEDGDYVIIRQQNHAEEGQIVVALVEDSATLKRYYLDRENRRIRLHPENSAMEDMYYDEIAIQGIAVKVIKDLEVE